MLSIITAVHNCLAMNRLYWRSLALGTTVPFQLIIVDNHSTDGSENFFRELAARSGGAREVVYLRNEHNQSYPASQNQGMKQARHDVLVFLNNDIWMPRGWHVPLERALAENPLLVVSPAGHDAQPTQGASNRNKRRWNRITWLSHLWCKALGKGEEERLWVSLRWMYGDLESFRPPHPPGTPKFFHGIKGDAVAFHRALLTVVPNPWDERTTASDWHLYLTLARLHEENPAIPLPRILRQSYVHHFGRYSARQRYEPLPGNPTFLSIDALWGEETVRRLWWGFHLPS